MITSGREDQVGFSTQRSILLIDSAKVYSAHEVEQEFSGVNCSVNIIHGILTPLLQFLDTYVNIGTHNTQVRKWEDWIEKVESEFTEKRFARRASYQLIPTYS